MIRFVRLGDQIIPGEEEMFAWYDTVVDQFVTTSDGQSQSFSLDCLFQDVLDPKSPIRQKRTEEHLFGLMGMRARFAAWLPSDGN